MGSQVDSARGGRDLSLKLLREKRREPREPDMASVFAGISEFIGKTLASNHVQIFDLRGSYGRQTVGFLPSTFWRT